MADIQFQGNNMKIYFAGSITGGRDDKELYSQIIGLLKNYGNVLTEHVGDPKLSSQGEVNVTDEYVYERDVAWMKESDVVITEVSTPSLGVGYEIGSAQSLNKKILCLYRESPTRRISKMIRGNKNLIFKTYKTIDDLPEIFNEFLK